MLRLTMATRLVTIVLVGMAIMWILVLAVFYRSQAEGDRGAWPAPERLAALVGLLETSPAAERPRLLDVVTTADFMPTVLAAPPAGLPDAAKRLSGDPAVRYAEALGDRPLSLFAVPRSALIRRFPRLAPASANALQFRIGLRTGETLVVETRNPFVINRVGLPLGFGAGLFGTFVAVVSLYVMQRETKPLARLAAAVDRVDLAVDPVPLPMPRRSAPEIRAVVAAFNRLQSRLGGMLLARMALIGGISHDVRTFAARLRLRVDGIADEDERQRAVADIDDMIRLLDDALLSSRAGAGELSLEMIEFADLVAAEVDDRHSHGEAVDLALDSGAGEAVVLGDRVALRRIVTNIVSNAVKYGRAAHVRVAVEEHDVLFRVDDEGPGIPAARREMLLEPFSRLETSRNRETGGAGLGLAVARALAEAHGGGIEIGETPAGNGRVTIRLQLFVPDAADETKKDR